MPRKQMRLQEIVVTTIMGWFLLFLVFLPHDVMALELVIGMPLFEQSKEYTLLVEETRRIADQTNGVINISIYSLADKKAEFGPKVLDKSLDGCLALEYDFETLGLGPDAYVYGFPFLFQSFEQMKLLRQELDDHILEAISQGPTTALGFVNFGFTYLVLGPDISLARPEQWSGLKIWVPEIVSVSTDLDMVGFQKVTADAKMVLAGLEDSSIEAVIAPLPVVIMKRWHTRIATVFGYPLAYTSGIWVFNDSVVNSLAEQEYELLKSSLQQLGQLLGSTFESREQSAKKVFARYGIESTNPTDEMTKQLKSWSREYYKNLPEKSKPSPYVVTKLQELTDGTVQ